MAMKRKAESLGLLTALPADLFREEVLRLLDGPALGNLARAHPLLLEPLVRPFLRKFNPSLLRPVQVLSGHTRPVVCLTVFKGMLVTGSNDKSIKFWNEEGECLKTLYGHIFPAICLTVFDDMLVSGSYDTDVRFWNKNGVCLNTLIGHRSWVVCLTVFEGMLISGSYDGTIKFWNKNGDCLNTLRGHLGQVTCLTVLKGILVSGSTDKTIKFWNKSGDCLKTLNGYTTLVTCLIKFIGRLVSASQDSTIKFWDENGECLQTCSFDFIGIDYPSFLGEFKGMLIVGMDTTAKFLNEKGDLQFTLQTGERVLETFGGKLFVRHGKKVGVWEIPQ